MNANGERQLSEVIAEAMVDCSPFAPGDFEYLVTHMPINEGHDNIVMAIDGVLKKNLHLQGGKRAALERIKGFVLAQQKAEAGKHANQVTDADKVVALKKVVGLMQPCARKFGVLLIVESVDRFMRLAKIAEDIDKMTKAEIKQALEQPG
ncbi:MAG: hypothetical protein NTW11_03900 [Candidatus Staskawiczbacteria bacterium]|nr:hypothetical protein [Candidatus Staskawiczbacteria bacterium]